MTEADARRVLRGRLTSLGVRAGDTVYLGVDMGQVPLPEYPADFDRESIRARADMWCAFVLDILLDTVGPEGTLLTPTFSYAYAREGTPYDHERTPSEAGPFTEFLRRRPEAVRSLHPLNSVSGIGSRAREILQDTGLSGYGVRSPFGRLADHETKFLFLGAPLGRALTHAHHLEHMYGVNHMYHKLYTVPVRRNGAEVPGPWLCFVRYLGVGIEPSIGALEERLRALRLLVEVGPPEQLMQLAHVRDVEAVGYRMLDDSPWAFAEGPVEIQVDSPGSADQPGGQGTVRYSRTE